jgi:hypothetical protein
VQGHVASLQTHVAAGAAPVLAMVTK